MGLKMRQNWEFLPFKGYRINPFRWNLAWHLSVDHESTVRFTCHVRTWSVKGVQGMSPVITAKLVNLLFPLVGDKVFTNQGEIWHDTVHHGSTLTCQIWLCLGKGGEYRSPPNLKIGLNNRRFRRLFAQKGGQYVPITLKFATEQYTTCSLSHANLGVRYGHSHPVGFAASRRWFQFLVFICRFLCQTSVTEAECCIVARYRANALFHP